MAKDNVRDLNQPGNQPPRQLAGKPEPMASVPSGSESAFAIGNPVDGARLWKVHLPGVKSRAVDKERDCAVMLDELPVWATSAGDARQKFESYNGIVSTTQTYQINPA